MSTQIIHSPETQSTSSSSDIKTSWQQWFEQLEEHFVKKGNERTYELQGKLANMSDEMQQMKSYVLSLEERIISLEKEVSTYRTNYVTDMQTIGSQMATLNSSLKDLEVPNRRKKRWFH